MSGDGKTITYSAEQKSQELITIEGVNPTFVNTNNLEVNEETKIVTIKKEVLDNTDVKISDGYMLELGEGISESEPIEEGFVENVYKSAGRTKGYKLSTDKKTITYNK